MEIVAAPGSQFKHYSMWLGIAIGTLDALILLISRFSDLHILTLEQVLGINAVLGFLVVPAKLVRQHLLLTTDQKIAVVTAAAAQPVRAGQSDIEVKLDEAVLPTSTPKERPP